MGIYQKELKAGIQGDICMFIFIAALFTVAKRQKLPMCPSVDEWINKMWYIHRLKHYSAFKRQEIQHVLQHG